MAAQFIFTMHKVGRFHPPDREVLKDISLSFYPGAKIGVIGANGSGKSSLLRIMAGIDTEYTGEARLTPGFTVGHLEQEPHLDAGQGRPRQRDGRRRRDGRACSSATTRCWRCGPTPTPTTRSSARSRPTSRPRSRPAARWDLEAHHRDRHGRAAAARRATPTSPCCPAASGAGSRCAGCSCPSPTCCCSTSRPTTSTPSRSRGSSGTSSSTRAPSSPSPTIATSSTTWRSGSSSSTAARGIPFEGNYSSWLEQKRARLEQEEQSDSRPQPHARARARVGAHGTEGPPGQGQGPAQRLREAARRVGRQRQAGRQARRSSSRPAPASATRSSTPIGLRKGYGDRLLIDDLSFILPPAGIVGVIGAERRGQDHAVPHDHRPGAARRRRAAHRVDRQAGLRRPEPRHARRRPHRLGGDQRQTRDARPRRQGGQQPGLRRVVQLQGQRPAEARRRALGR